MGHAMTEKSANDALQLESIRRANEQARMRQFMQPGRGYKVNFWRRIVRAVLRGLT
jgi:hypothetical protein